ncbi:FGGY family carbohydrate kinase [uncultured Muriicola sp.]|uniref:xylulokinase n=1 Tax=uncultured Muriicola sp. TaxID=1583102 RepID=UPI00261344DD|nr:FGGY family carbohydrate kinase [uncultured Muriicola sp.]
MYYLGYDIGSSSIKVALVQKADGKVVGVVKEPPKEMSILSPQHNWAEQDPEEWWRYVCSATQKLITTYHINKKDILGIGISYQMHGLVLIDKAGALLRNAIIWCDSRAVDIGNDALKNLGSKKCATHLLNAPGNFTASKLKWVKDNEAALYGKMYKAMLPGDYIAFKLSDKIATTLPGLTEGVFWDFKEQKIAEWLLAYYGLTRDLLPEVVPTFGAQGKVSAKAAAETGLAKDTPILYRAGDQPNNALSLNVFHPGEIAMTGGTSGVIYAIGDQLKSREISRINNFAHVNYIQKDPILGKLLCINGAGIQYRWLRENLQVDTYEKMNALANTVPVASEGVLVLPFGNGAERMLNNKNIGSQILHLDLNLHTKAHLCRAALEGIAFAFMYGMEILKAEGVQPKVIRAGNDNLFQSEVFTNTICTLIGHPIELYDTTGAVGAARACALQDGDFTSLGETLLKNDHLHTFYPLKDLKPYQKAYQNWKEIIDKDL